MAIAQIAVVDPPKEEPDFETGKAEALKRGGGVMGAGPRPPA